MVRRNSRRRFTGGEGDPMGDPTGGTQDSPMGDVPPHSHDPQGSVGPPLGGGGRRRRRQRKGGSFRSAVGTALTPLALFVAHNRLSKRRKRTGRKRNRSKKYRFTNKRRRSGRRRRR
tara:strand:+ start:8 stop:358 length:351 start_codon:yes stop_codon:yes gene_type:complete